MKIAVGGFQHETNTFAESRADIDDFQMADSWPKLLIDEEVVTHTRGMNLPIAGALSVETADLAYVPTIWCSAEPSGFVTDDAFDLFSQMIIDKLQQAEHLDGVYLDLHGAMVTNSHQDGEAELLRRIRLSVGDELPIAVSLDLHANLSPELIHYATLITIYRTYPHLDMAETGERCMLQLLNVIKGQPIYSAFQQIPFLIPLHSQYTGQTPCKELYQKVAEMAEAEGEWVDIALGFTAADIYHCGPSVVAYAQTQARANSLASTLSEFFKMQRSLFETKLLPPTQAIAEAKSNQESLPVVIADVQDNPGAGGTSDTTGLLHALIEQQATAAVLGVMCDSKVAANAHQQGLNTVFQAELGGQLALGFGEPVRARFKVVSLSDGEIRYTGAMYRGGVATLGPSCLLSIEQDGLDIQVVVSSIRIQCLDQALFKHFGIDLARTRIIGVKSTVHHRADFEPIASRILNIAAPGAFPCLLNIDDYQHLRSGVHCLYPSVAKPLRDKRQNILS